MMDRKNISKIQKSAQGTIGGRPNMHITDEEIVENESRK